VTNLFLVLGLFYFEFKLFNALHRVGVVRREDEHTPVNKRKQVAHLIYGVRVFGVFHAVRVVKAKFLLHALVLLPARHVNVLYSAKVFVGRIATAA